MTQPEDWHNIGIIHDQGVWATKEFYKPAFRGGRPGAILACMLGGSDRRTLFILAAKWRGPDAVADAARTGQVLTAKAPAPGIGWPSQTSRSAQCLRFRGIEAGSPSLLDWKQ